MAVPTRPAAGAPIDAVWGQVAHDTAVAVDIQYGTVTVVSGTGVSQTATVTFPRAFASAPIVCFGSNNFNGYAGTDGTVPTTTQFKVVYKRIDGGATGAQVVPWIAIGARA